MGAKLLFQLLIGPVILLAIFIGIFVYMVIREGRRDEVKLTDEQAKELNDTLFRQYQEQEARRLLLIDRENKDVELDKED